MAHIDDLVDIHGIAEILQYAHETNATLLCRKGRLKTARKVGNSWTAERWEVELLREKLAARKSKKMCISNKEGGG